MDFKLSIYKDFDIFINVFLVFFHKLCKGFALNIVKDYCPLTVNYAYLVDFWYIKTCFFNPCVVKGFVEYISLGIIFVKKLYAVFIVSVYFFVF